MKSRKVEWVVQSRGEARWVDRGSTKYKSVMLSELRKQRQLWGNECHFRLIRRVTTVTETVVKERKGKG